MNELFDKIKTGRKKPIKELFKGESGAIDLASIMVGIIVIGLIGGVIAATVFAVIPWAQDNAAKQQLDSIVQAENAYFGLSAADPSPLPVGHKTNVFGTSAELANANLLFPGPRYCATTPSDSKSYTGYSQSYSGNIFTVTDKNSKPVQLIIPAGSTSKDSLPLECQFIADGMTASNPVSPPVSYVDPTPQTTILTYRCDTTTSGIVIPMKGTVGTETWNDGPTHTYAAGNPLIGRTLVANTTYTLTFEGTYSTLTHLSQTPLAKCLRAVNHWGTETGVTDANGAFIYANNLTSVPDHIPTTIKNARTMFYGATIINDPSISKWDVSNITDMAGMFNYAEAFNQPLNGWNTSNVTYMTATFANAKAFNQPIDKWNTSKVTEMGTMFQDASSFNQDINNWDVSNVISMFATFNRASAFNKPLNGWKTGNVTTMNGMFQDATSFNQPLDQWNTAKVTNISSIFAGASQFNQPIANWNVSNVTNSLSAFNGASQFNQPLASWNVSKMTDVSYMFANATNFVQNLSGWNTISVSQGTKFAPTTFPTSYLPPKTSL